MALRLGDAAWLSILAYEVFCPPEETLSKALDRLLTPAPPAVRRGLKHWLIEAGIFYVALHCANRLPERYDATYHAHELLRKQRRW